MKSELINMTQAWDKEKIWVPNRTWTVLVLKLRTLFLFIVFNYSLNQSCETLWEPILPDSLYAAFLAGTTCMCVRRALTADSLKCNWHLLCHAGFWVKRTVDSSGAERLGNVEQHPYEVSHDVTVHGGVSVWWKTPLSTEKDRERSQGGTRG